MAGIFTNPTAPERYIPRVVKHEESLQRQACSYLRKQWPRVIFRSDYSAGLRLTQNQARINASMQSGRGFPDLFIYEPMTIEGKHYCGMALELKRDKTAIIVTKGPRKGHLVADKHIQEQYLMLKELARKGYYTDFGIGIDDTLRKLQWYLSGGIQNLEMF
jgi:hypothetical protein